jgi:hypothetical protein
MSIGLVLDARACQRQSAFLGEIIPPPNIASSSLSESPRAVSLASIKPVGREGRYGLSGGTLFLNGDFALPGQD